MKIGIYPTSVPNAGLGGDAWQCFEIDENDVDGGQILAYFHHNTPKAAIEKALRAMHPECDLDWMDE